MAPKEWSYLGALGKLSLRPALVVALFMLQTEMRLQRNVCRFGSYCQIWLDRVEKDRANARS
jgi:hypothetical protein